ncbi:hypothetical protein [Spiroplasma gladiatoris]|uniref:hypothetical protein n=1 Tax=Spiroplasma gladiatoris TaxID=2143 RepID=UPI001419774D|nr:hypothetical protein [Spiroplasma gladiatoris]
MAILKGNRLIILDFDTKKELINKYFNQNLSFRDLAKTHNISYSTVRWMCLDWEVYGD